MQVKEKKGNVSGTNAQREGKETKPWNRSYGSLGGVDGRVGAGDGPKGSSVSSVTCFTGARAEPCAGGGQTLRPVRAGGALRRLHTSRRGARGGQRSWT